MATKKKLEPCVICGRLGCPTLGKPEAQRLLARQIQEMCDATGEAFPDFDFSQNVVGFKIPNDMRETLHEIGKPIRDWQAKCESVANRN